MSREVDSRVVEMQFDGTNFEKNTKRTIGAIDRLMEKLQFKGAEKSFEQLDAAAAKVDFADMNGALETLEGHFSTLNIIGTTALVNITNKAVDAGTRLVKSLSLDQVMSGWNKYAQKTASVQTIMNATGKSITKVNSYLDKLMWYSDETSYSFTDMTASLGQLTAAGGNIDRLMPMIMGIANATAYAGKGASEFSRVIYNLNQSYSQGYLSLMDWKSVELAGVATAELKQQLIDTGVAMGKIKQGEVTVGGFASSLSSKWADKAVMETAFGRLAEFSDAVKKAVDAKQYKTAAAAIEALAGQYDEVTVRAFKAAQEAKSFGEAVDATKDAVSSGWLETFEIIFGNYEEAKKLWTDLANEMYDLFAASKDSRNDLLHSALDSGWTQLMQNGLSNVSDVLESGLQVGFNSAGIITEKDIANAGSFQDALGNALRTGKISADNLEQAIRGAADSYDQLNGKSDEEIRKLGYTRNEIERNQKAFSNFVKRINDGEISIEEFAGKLAQVSGRQHVFNGILNVLKAINSVIEPVREAFFSVLAPSDKGLYKTLQTFDEFTRKMIISETTAQNLTRMFSGVFSILKIGLNILTNTGKLLLAGLQPLIPVGKKLLEIAAYIGDYFVSLEASSTITRTFGVALSVVQDTMTKLSSALQVVIGWVEEFGIRTVTLLKPFEAMKSAIESFVGFVASKFQKLSAQMREIFSQLGNSALNGFGSLNGNALWGFVNAGLITSVIAGLKGFVSGFKELGSTAKGVIDSVSDLLNKLGESITAWKTNKNAETLKTIATSIAILAGALVVLSMVSPEKLAASIGALTALFIELIGAVALLTEFTKNNNAFGKGTKAMTAMAAAVLILSVALVKIGSIDTQKLLSSVIALAAIMAELVIAQISLSKFAPQGAKHAASILVMASAMVVLSKAVESFAVLKWNEIAKGLSAVGGLLIEIGVFAAASKYSGLSLGNATAIVLLSGALLILQKAVSALGEMDTEKLQRGLISTGLILGEIAVFDVMSSAASHVMSTALALSVLSGSMLAFTKVINSLGGMTVEQLAIALGALAIGLTEMGIALTVVGSSIGSAASFLVMSVALSMLVVPLKALGQMELAEIGKSLLVLGGSMAIMALTVGALSYIGPIVIAVSVALSLLAGSLAALLLASAATDFIGNLSAGLASLQTIRLEAFVNTLMTIGLAVGYFVAGLIAGLGKAIGSIATAISEIIVALCEALTAAVPAIGETLIAIINTLCKVLISCTPQIGEALVVLIYELCDVLVACTPKILDTIDSVFGAIFSYVGSKFGALGRWLSDKVNKAFISEHGTSPGSESGQYVAEGYSKAIEEGTADAASATENLAKAQDDAFNDYWDINSPAKRAIENAGYIIGGYVEGIQNGKPEAESAMTGLARSMDSAFRDELGIHSNADDGIESGEFYDGGVIEGLENRENEVCDTAETLGEKTHEAYLNGLKKELNAALDTPGLTPQERRQLMLDMRDSGVSRIATSEKANGLNWMTIFGGLANPAPEKDSGNTGPTPTGTGGKTKTSGGSKTKKTVAESLAEEYTKKLKANKYLQDALDKETTLWNLRNEDAVSNEELLAKRSETVAKSIELQTQRVAIAQEQYDQLLSKAPTDDKTKDAYNTLLDEQANLEKLKQSRRDDIWKDLLTRYENDTKTAENEYELWSAVYGDSANVTEKANKQMEAINAKIKIQAQVLSAAEQDYTELKAEFGDESQRTQEAYRKYLEEQKNQQDLINELEQAQLDQFDNQIARWEKEYQLLQNRQKMLEKIYNDGDLAGQKDAYDSAVQKYGKDSKEARAAGMQGVMSSLVATGTAIADIGQSWKKLAEYQAKYDAIEDKSSDKALDAYAALQSEQYNLVGFAESLASAMDMGDTGKKAMMQLGYSIAQNWKSVQNGMNKVWDRLPENLKTGISKATNLAMTDGAAETISSTAQMIVAVMSGDYATATVAGLNTVLNFMNTEFGQKVLSGLADLFDKAGKTAQSSGLVTKLVGLIGQSGDKVAGLLGAVGGKIAEVTGSVGGELAGLLGTVGTGIAEVAAAIGPEGLLIGAAVAGGAALIANWDKIDQWLEGVFDWLGNFFKKLWDGICGFFGGIIDGIKGLFGIHSPSRVMSDIGSNIVLGLEEGINDTADGAKDVALNCAQQVLDVFDEDSGTYEPRIRPVVDLTDAENGAAWMRANLGGGERAVALDVSRSASLADGVSRNAAAQKEAQRRAAAEKDTADTGNRDVVDAIGALGARIDGVAESVSRMKVCLNKRKVVGEILTDVDEGMGDRLV